MINIAGLAIGISSALVIYLIVSFEFSFEKFRKDEDRIYRVVSDITFPGEVKFRNSGVPMPMPKAVRSDLTGIETVTQFVTAYEPEITIPAPGNGVPAQYRKQTDIIYTDADYFSIFQYDWVTGSAEIAMHEPFRVVLTEERARLYFGDMPYKDMMGRQVIYNDSIKTTVAGIVKFPREKATDFRFREFISLPTIMTTGLVRQYGGDEWGNISSSSQMFVKLKKGIDPATINTQFAGLRLKYNPPDKGDKDDTGNHLQALADIHFNPDYDTFNQRQAHRPTLYGLLAVAAFLLLLGCINFINLTTAQSAQRAREIGIRKTLGSGKRQIIGQFLTVTLLLTVMATVLSIAITPWLLNIFKDFIPPEISFASINQLHVWIFLLLLVLLMTLLSGFYPAWVLTAFKPVNVLKDNQQSGGGQNRKTWLRKSLTVTQFVIAQFLVVATLVVSEQIHYSLNRDLGYKKEAILYFRTPHNNYSREVDNRRFTLFDRLKNLPGIEKLSLGGAAPAHNSTSSTSMKVDNGKKEVELMVEVLNADPDYFDIYQMKLLAGRYPSKSDTLKEYLVNQTFASAVGWTDPEKALGQMVTRGKARIPIVGLLADFHTKSTHEPIKPLAYSSADNSSYMMHLSLSPRQVATGQWKETIHAIEKDFKALYPEDDFQYEFFDDTIAAFYKKEQDISRLLNWAAGLSIFISCLGLLGLVIFTTNNRVKEIGIRKVLGASVAQIVSILTKDLVILVLVAFVIATPLAWMAMHKWLDNFVYRTSIGWWVFAVCGLGMFVLAILILSLRTIQAARANPVKSLRTE